VCAQARAQNTAADPIAALIARMTLEEKLGQLSQWSGGTTPTGPKAASGSENDIRAGRIGSFLGVWGADSTRRLQEIAVKESRLHIPLLFSYDVIHGLRTIFPVPLAESASFDPALAERTARAAAMEATAWGLHWNYAPMVDIARDARWGRGVEGAGEDPYLGAALAVARVRGFQAGDARDGTRLIATAKHFVAYGAAEAGRDYNSVDVSQRALREVYFPPFRAAVEAGVGSVMTAFNDVSGVPMHAHAELVQGTLRKAWGFHGIVVSDYTGIKELLTHGVARDRAHAGELALRATVDVDMISAIYGNDIAAQVKNGHVPMAQIDAAVRRVLVAKQQLGLFEDPFRYCDAARETARTFTPETRALARESAQESIVLLKNDRQTLPLRKEIATIAVVGALASDQRVVLGNWAALGEPREAVSVLDGIKQAVSPATRVIYARGASPTSTDRSGLDEAVAAARAADVVIAVVGETEDMSGEARSRSWLGLSGAQAALIERVHATGKPVVAVLMNGRPLALGWLHDHVPAIVEGWFLGNEAGHALADVLFGVVNPSGKLPVTFPRSTGQVPLYYAHKNTGRPPSMTDPYTSRYLDVPWTPLYPFGYGLSYTQFRYDVPQLSAAKLGPSDTLTVRVRLQNVGERAGTEVVQLYLRDDVGSTARPVQALRGFERVTLEPREARELTFTLDAEDFALLDDTWQRVVEAGTFTVMVGGNARDVQSQQFEITRSAKLVGPGSAIPRFLRTNTKAGAVH
jgi:beta-glucosidase